MIGLRPLSKCMCKFRIRSINVSDIAPYLLRPSSTFGVHNNAFRYASTSSPVTTQLPDILSVAIPEPPSLQPVSDLVLNAIGEPSLSSLGLCSYWPSGWYQSLVEVLHVSADLPWWGAILATTVMVRLALFPFIIDQRRHLAKYSTYMPQMTVLQERMTQARLAGDPIDVMRVSKEMQSLMQKGGMNPMKSIRLLLIQFPIFLSVFAGIRGMASLPVPSLQTGGLYWFADLTVSDPYCILPLISMASILIMFETGADISSQQVTPMVRLFMRIFPCFGFFMVMNMPAALLWYWSVSNCISLVQASILRQQIVRQWLKLPEVSKPPPAVLNKRGFIEGFQESFKNSKLIAELEARERMDAKSWQQAAKGSVPRTFNFDPTLLDKRTVIPTTGTAIIPKTADPTSEVKPTAMETRRKANQRM